MHSVRTKIPRIQSSDFRIFLEAHDLEELIVGDYEDITDTWYSTRRVCYAYSDSFTKAVANMTYIALKYGSVEKAFYELT